MLTNRAPFEYLYLSERLLTDVFQHDRAVRTKWTAGLDINLHVFGLHLVKQPVDLNNLHDLAAHSSDLVSDHVGRVGTYAPYAMDQLELRHGVFAPMMGWRSGRIACYWGEASTPESGLTFVALFGSASNVVGRRRTDDEELEYYPSDAAGLYGLLDATRERSDPEIDLDYRLEDYGMSEEARAENAIMFARASAEGEARHVDFLARILFTHEDYNRDGEVYDRVVVGAPLWIATPNPRPLSGEDPSRFR